MLFERTPPSRARQASWRIVVMTLGLVREFEPGATPKSGAQVIKAIRGSTLVVAPVA